MTRRVYRESGRPLLECVGFYVEHGYLLIFLPCDAEDGLTLEAEDHRIYVEREASQSEREAFGRWIGFEIEDKPGARLVRAHLD
ncbi:MAG: hypothetical protein KDC27_11845 [Acidobacteria bacterium]|nr:hypothetical protein [Acidobacteriota bacterium]